MALIYAPTHQLVTGAQRQHGQYIHAQTLDTVAMRYANSLLGFQSNREWHSPESYLELDDERRYQDSDALNQVAQHVNGGGAHVDIF